MENIKVSGRDDVVFLMTQTVDDINREIGKAQNMSEQETESLISGMREQVMFVNALLYDKLVEFGVIVEG
jgi:hypothetical protein